MDLAVAAASREIKKRSKKVKNRGDRAGRRNLCQWREGHRRHDRRRHAEGRRRRRDHGRGGQGFSTPNSKSWKACSSTAATSRYFITNAEKMVAELGDPYILIHERSLEPASVAPVFEADGAVGAARSHRRGSCRGRRRLPRLVVDELRGGLKVAAVKAPGFGDRRKAMLEDIAVLSGGQPVI